MIAIIVSKLDPAGMNIAKELFSNGFEECEENFDGNGVYQSNEKNMKLYFINSDQIFADYVDKINCKLFVFASKHSSESKRPTLTVHPIGNWAKAHFGGKDFELVPTSSAVMKAYICYLNELKKKLCIDYDVVYEATHHGPYLTKPALYIEIGSSIAQWTDTKAANVVAKTIVDADYNIKSKAVLGFGGLHYNQHFTKMALETELAFSHMCPKHYLAKLTKESIEKAIKSTVETVKAFVIEKKGLSTEKARVISMLEDFGLEIIKT
ncbi:MAG: D-tyrosyl-tRNA(Tyr) deacylase [Candidatus Diapherotrites archaeon]|nr:D-tyrosyl-tRNA(Tyr) deacylase [Candidatus Diapherotrites archaeon]